MRIKYLDGIKGLAALGVFLGHYRLLFNPPQWFTDNIPWVMNAGFAVALFLIISGFSAWLSVKRKLESKEKVGHMVINRYLRFAIPFGIVFALLYLLYFTGVFDIHAEAGRLSGSHELESAFWPVGISGFVKALVLSPVGADFWDAPLWMMKYVFLGTYIALLLQLGMDGKSRRMQMLILFVAFVFFCIWDVFYLGVMYGLVLGFFYSIRANELSIRVKILLGGVNLALMVITHYCLPAGAEVINFTAALFLILGIYCIPLLQRILELRILQYLGKISFGVYLLHWPILCSLTSLTYVKTQAWEATDSFLFTFTLTVVAVLVASHLFWKLVETRLSNYIINRIFRLLETR